MKPFRSFCDSDIIGKGDWCERIHFECDLNPDGAEGEINCWYGEFQYVQFESLPLQDRTKILAEIASATSERFPKMSDWEDLRRYGI